VDSTKSRRARVDRPFRALRVSWATRIALRWHARADRRAGLPLGMGDITTPTLQDLTARYGDACERERAAYLAEVRPIDVRLGRLEAELPSLRAARDERAAELARLLVPLTERQLTRRLAGEQDLSETLVRQRRQTTHDRAAEAAREAWRETVEAVDESLAEMAQLQARRRKLAEITCSRVLRYGEHIRRRAALYRRALVRKHTDREALVHQWRTELCQAPEWADPAVLISSPREVGVAA
jgi:hypothetical protein